MRRYLLALVLTLLAVAQAWGAPLPTGTYPGYLIIHPDGSQEVRASIVQPVTIYRVATSVVGPGTVTGEGTYQNGGTVVLTATPVAGYTVRWGGDAECEGVTFTITRSVTCVATFSPEVTPRTLTIQTTGTGSGTTDPPVGTRTFLPGATVTLTNTPAAGSTFVSWSPSPCAASFAMPDADLTCTATFNAVEAPPQYALTLAQVGQGTVGGAGSFVAGATVTLTATAATGWTFDGWGPPPCQPLFAMPANALTCTATFIQDSTPPDQGVTLAMAWQGATVDRVRPGNGSTAHTPDGLNDGEWLVTVSGAGRQIAYLTLSGALPVGTRTYDTNWNTSDPILGVALSQGGALLNSGTNGSVNFAVTAGSTFNIFHSSTGENNFATGLVYTLTATFSDSTTASTTGVIGGAATRYALTLQAAGTGTGTVSGAGSYVAGATVTLTATPATGSTFAGWSPSPCANSFSMPASTLTCTATFTSVTPPTPRVLTVVTVGNGTTTGGGSYLAGASVSLTATPATGWVFSGWSPSPCANSFTMPNADLTCTATFTQVTTTPGGSWSVISDTGVPRFSWLNLAVDTTRRRLYALDWDGNLNAFPLATNGPWTILNKPFNDTRHNGTIVYEPVNDRIWTSQFAPASEGSQWVYDAAPARWSQATLDPGGSPGSSALMVYEPTNNRLIGAGGWHAHMSGRIVTLPLSPLTVNWTSTSQALSLPFSEDCERPAHLRGGWDSTRNRTWFIAVDGALWTLSGTTWTRTPTTGGPPPRCTIYGYLKGADKIVGWSSADTTAGFDPNDPAVPIKRETWLLDIATLVWSLGPTAAAGNLVPPLNGLVGFSFAPDPGDDSRLIMLAGGSSTKTWAFTMSSSTPPPPPASYAFTLDKSGTGTGTVTGGGTYVAGATVTITASVGASTTFTGWTGSSPCPTGTTSPATFVMPARALTCGAVFTSTGNPGGPGSGGAIQAGVFVARPYPSIQNSGPPFSSGSKHTRFVYNPINHRLYNGGGDWGSLGYISSFNSSVWSYDVATNAWTMEEDYCGAPGEITPDHPDTTIFTFDTTRNQYLMLGIYFGTAEGQTCSSSLIPGSGSTYTRGLLAFNITTKTWSKIRSAGTFNASFGVYDPATDEIIYIQNAGCANQIGRHRVSDGAVRTLDWCISGYPGSPQGTYSDEANARNDPWAWDPVARKGYWVFWVANRVNFEVVSYTLKLFEFNAATGVITAKANPPIPAGYSSHVDATPVYWDSVNSRVLFPHSNGYCGIVQAISDYNPSTNTWTTRAVVTDPPGLEVRANTGAFDPHNNALMLGGSAACGDEGTPVRSAPNTLFLYRHGP